MSAGVLDALGIDRVDLVGHDWGGVIGFLVCLNHTSRVERYVPMNTGHVWPTLGLKGVPKQLGATAYQGLLASPVLGRRINASPRIVGKVVGAISAQTDSVLPQYQEHSAPRLADKARAKAASQVYRTFVLYEYPRWVRGLYRDRRLTTPTLWLHGLSDPFFKPGMFKDIVDHADDVRIEYLEGCGHFPAEECPQIVADHHACVLRLTAPTARRAQPGRSIRTRPVPVARVVQGRGGHTRWSRPTCVQRRSRRLGSI